MNLSGKRILLGVTGGIAAYKSATLLREFQKAGAEVRVTMTSPATRFVGTETFSTLSRHEVAVDIFGNSTPSQSWTKHIHWGSWADIFVIAPCTANTLAKLVHGQADNMLTSIALAIRCPLLICPTMDAEMAVHPAVSRNMNLADELGYHLLKPDSGYLASGLEGTGRLPEASAILEKTVDILESNRIKGPLSKKKVVVTAGPTREKIDPVRYLSNPSSGKMGIAMAEAARDMGGDVHLLHGPLHIPLPADLTLSQFTSANDLFELMKTHADADVIIMCAAVADFRPADVHVNKIKKESGTPEIKLAPNPDILKWLGKQKKKSQILIGFAMETENLEANARHKLDKKNLDWICANNLGADDSGFQSDTNRIQLIGPDSNETFQGEKKQIAKEILQQIFG